uniref:Uncharacterized protein n=1 Tax=Megaselia scalaris TaxID=36166 RepID=T1H3J2_MEGSC
MDWQTFVHGLAKCLTPRCMHITLLESLLTSTEYLQYAYTIELHLVYEYPLIYLRKTESRLRRERAFPQHPRDPIEILPKGVRTPGGMHSSVNPPTPAAFGAQILETPTTISEEMSFSEEDILQGGDPMHSELCKNRNYTTEKQAFLKPEAQIKVISTTTVTPQNIRRGKAFLISK